MTLLLLLKNSVAPAPTGIPGSWVADLREEFTGTTLDTTKWTKGWFPASTDATTSPVGGANEDAFYEAGQVAVSGGNLSITMTAKTQTIGGVTKNWATGLVTTNGLVEMTYGAVEARMYVPPGADGKPINWPAFWLDSHNWPTTGELDVMEGLDGNAGAHFHYDGGGGTNVGPGFSVSGNYSGWHTYGAVWDAGVVTYYYDGVEVGLISEGITSAPMYLILGFGPRTTGSVAGTMLVDYVRTWHRAGATPAFAPVSDTFSSGTVPSSALWQIGTQPGSAVVSGGRMVVTSGASTYTQGPVALLSGMVPVSDVDLSLDLGTDATEQYLTVSARVDRFLDNGAQPYPDNGYYIEIQPGGGQFIVGRSRDGSRTTLGTYAYTFSSSVRTGIRLRLTGSLVQVRLWDLPATEPTTWQHNATDTTPLLYAGKVLLVSGNGNNAARAVSWDNVAVALPPSAPTALTAAVSEADTLAATLKSAAALAANSVETDTLAATLVSATALTAGFAESDSLTASLVSATALTLSLAEADTLSASLVSTTVLAAALSESDTLSATLVSTTSLTAALADSDSLTAALVSTTVLAANFAETDSLSASLSTATTLAANLSESDTLAATLQSATALSASLAESDAVTATLRSATVLSGALSEADALAATLRSATALTAATAETDTLTASLVSATVLAAAITDADLLACTLTVAGAISAALVESDTLSVTLVSRTVLAGGLTESDTLAATLKTSTALAATITGTDTVTATLELTAALAASSLEADTLAAQLRSPVAIAATLVETDGLDASLLSPDVLAAALVEADQFVANLTTADALIAAFAEADTLAALLVNSTGVPAPIVTHPRLLVQMNGAALLVESNLASLSVDPNRADLLVNQT